VTPDPLMTVRADLHVHTALSPCGDDEMSPPAIVDAALAAGLDVIAVCDHNAAGNTGAVGEAAGSRLTVISGIEITTAEEVHIVGLFPTSTGRRQRADEVRETLPVADDDYTRFFGEQYLMSADGTIYGREPRALAMATSLSLDEAVGLIRAIGGLVIAAHIDRRPSASSRSSGFFPYEAGFDAVELSRHVPADSPTIDGYAAYGLPVVRSSDSHYLEDVGCVATEFGLAAPTFRELVLALKHREGRVLTDA